MEFTSSDSSAATNQSDQQVRVRLLVAGIVQGVGFRPFVYHLACRNRLTGTVRNNGGIVEIEVQGEYGAIEQFCLRLKDGPVLARIDRIARTNIECTDDESDFRIIKTEDHDRTEKFVPPDCATCDQCLAELFAPGDRRFRYPFINCVNCGPRFTIIQSLPYDRKTTTMHRFVMCERCQAEYDDPADRRFHAQPNACRDCGPTLEWLADSESLSGEQALERCIESLRDGQIVAVKGLGGFQLICAADNDEAVLNLRQRKRRSRKPFAVMFSDM
ncbi:MAG TPA: acylphosphatase, partial [Chroococcales cyanobacterium]